MLEDKHLELDEVTKMIGSLYLELNHQMKMADSVVQQYQEKVRQLELENLSLKRELERRNGQQKRDEASTANVG